MSNNHVKSKRELQAEAMKKSFIANAIPFLVEFYHKTKAGYTKFPAGDLCVKHDLASDIVPAMVDLRIIKVNGSVVSRHYFWSAVHLAPTTTHLKNDLAEKLYHKVQEKRRVYQANKKLEEMHQDRVKAKNLTPIIGTTKLANEGPSKNVMVYRALSALFLIVPGIEHPKKRDILDQAVIDEIGHEQYNTLGKQVIEAVLASNIIVPTITGSFSHPQLFYWKEAKPDEATVEFVVAMMSELKDGNKRNTNFEEAKKERGERILKYLHLLYNNRQIPDRFKAAKVKGLKEFRIHHNAATVIHKAVLFGGKWMGAAPTKEFAEKLNDAVSEYTAQFALKKQEKTNKVVAETKTIQNPVHITQSKTYDFTPNHTVEENKPSTELQEACDMVAKLEIRRREILDKLKEVDESIELGKQIITNLQNQAFKTKFEHAMAK